MQRVTVVIPIYNVENYIKRAVESVSHQTMSDIEILLIDDGSTDSSGKLCDDLCKTDDRIKVLHTENRGLGAARNLGIEEASGEYIAFLDADDWLEENAVEIAVDAMDRTGADCVTFNMRLAYDDAGKNQNIIWNVEELVTNFHNDEDRLKFICQELAMYHLSWEAYTYVFKTDYLRNNKICCHENKGLIAEDLFFSLINFTNITRICRLPHILYNYYQREESMLHVRSEINRLADISRVLSENFKYLEIHKRRFYVRNFNMIYESVMAFHINSAINSDGNIGLAECIEELKTDEFYRSMVKKCGKKALGIESKVRLLRR